MAERVGVVTKHGSLSMGVDGFLVTWSGLLNGDTGDSQGLGGVGDRSIQVTGTFGAGGNLKVLGSNDGANYTVLTDPQGNALDITTSKIEAISEAVKNIKVQVSAGDGTTDLTASLYMRRSR